MAFTYRNVKGSELSYAELDENFETVELLHDETQLAKGQAVSSAAIAVALAHFEGEWSGLSGELLFPASTVKDGSFYALLGDLPDVTAAEPGVSPLWELIPLGNPAAAIHAAPAKATPVDADQFGYVDSADSWRLVTATWANIKAALSALFATKTGVETLENKTIKGVRETGPAAANAGSAYTVDLANGSIFDLTLNANCTFTFPTPAFGKQFTLLIKNSGAYTYTMPASHRMDDGAALPVIASGKTASLSYISDGTYWLCYVGAKGHTRA